jgi:predicted extracellular nuclease
MKKFFTLLLSFTVFIAAYSQPVVISQIYGGGGNANASYQNDYIELFNPTNNSISLAGYAVQYAGATGTTWDVVNLTGNIPARGYYLIQLSSNAAVGSTLPMANATGTINLAAAGGKVALTNTITPLLGSCSLGTTVVDFVGYGAANCFFGTGAAPGPSNNTTAVTRNSAGTINTDNNATDFTTAAANPRNSAIILPVSLLSFTVSTKNNNIVFNWKTATETNTNRFEIEQSTNGKDFTTIATVAAAGNSSVEKSYAYTGNINPVTTYYRLKMIDADGKSTTSAIVKIAASKNGFALGNVYPVPAKNKVTVEWNSNHTSATTISIIDVNGRTVRTANVQAVTGFNQFVLDIQTLNAGQYFIRLKSETNQAQTIITKQ